MRRFSEVLQKFNRNKQGKVDHGEDLELLALHLQPMPWFHGKITRELAEELLTPKEEGLFLVRENAHSPGDYTLCVWLVTIIEF